MMTPTCLGLFNLHTFVIFLVTYRILRANRVVYLLKPGRLQMHCTLCDIHVRDISCVCHLCGACELICLEDIMSF